ncbi:MAG: DUF3667 domain-containing protein [Bacteroidota bacterium]
MNCKNCTLVLEASDNYCKSCGAKVIRNRLNFRNLWNDFSHQFLNYDNRFLKTFLDMFRRPQVVIGDYITGTRKKYVNVISYFAIALTFSGIQIFILQKFYPESLDMSVLVPDNVPQAEVDTSWIYDYFSILAMINLPFYAIMGRITFLGLKKFNYTEHLVIITYIVAQFSILNSVVITSLIVLLDSNFYLTGYVSTFIMMIFTGYTYKRLYPLSALGIFGRTLFFLFVIIVFIIALGIVQVIIMVIMEGGFGPWLEKQKAAQEAISYIASSARNWTS